MLTSISIVALAEIGDKTQLLAIVLATRFKRPLPIICGILVATLANHFLAALVGSQVASFFEGVWFRYAVAFSFLAMSVWTLIPDSLDDVNDRQKDRFGAFVATLIAFFIVEMGDKTQVATVALGAQFHSVLLVTTGTTIGMMLANVPAVVFGKVLIERVPLRIVRFIAAGLFFLVGMWLLLETANLI